MSWPTSVVLTAAVAIVVASCAGTSADPTTGEPSSGSGSDGDTATAAVSVRLGEIEEMIAVWRSAPTIDEALVAAETAANLVVGPNGPGYGDRNGDGTVSGSTDDGLLPGLDGSPAGLATSIASNECVLKDVLGGSWEDPPERWDEMERAIEAWRPDNNTMPSLASHPMRIVGWATFSQSSDSLEEIHTYAGHAALHIAISQRSLDC
jgi:hypothetical protein